MLAPAASALREDVLGEFHQQAGRRPVTGFHVNVFNHLLPQALIRLLLSNQKEVRAHPAASSVFFPGQEMLHSGGSELPVGL